MSPDFLERAANELSKLSYLRTKSFLDPLMLKDLVDTDMMNMVCIRNEYFLSMLS